MGHGGSLECVRIPSSISVVEREPGITRLPVALYIYVVGCYAKCILCKGRAWNNNYSEQLQEEAMLV